MSGDVAAVLARGMASADGFPGAAKPEAYERDAQACLAALAAAGYAVVKVPEQVGWAADAFTRQAELDEYGYFSVNGEQDRDHPVPLYAIGGHAMTDHNDDVAAEVIRLRELLGQIRLLALEANEEYESSCRRKVARIYALANIEDTP